MTKAASAASDGRRRKKEGNKSATPWQRRPELKKGKVAIHRYSDTNYCPFYLFTSLYISELRVVRKGEKGGLAWIPDLAPSSELYFPIEPTK